MGMLRFFLAWAVMVSHSPDGVLSRVLHPGIAVQCFYSISGFLIQLAILNYYSREDRNWPWRFYTSRALRLMPVYYIMLAATLLAFDMPYVPGTLEKETLLPLLLSVFVNVFIFGQDVLRLFTYDITAAQFALLPPYINNTLPLINDHTVFGAAFSVLKQSWSIAVEFWFYLFAPFLLLRRTRWLVAIIIASIAFRLIIASHGYAFHMFMNGIILNEIAIFLSGALMARFYLHSLISGKLETNLQNRLGKNARHALSGVCFLALGMLFYYLIWGWHTFPQGGDWMQDTYNAKGLRALAVPYRYWMAIIFTVICLPWIFYLTSRFAWDRWVGDLSYPLYISHTFFISLFGGKLLNPRWECFYIAIASLALSVVLVYLVDRPIEKFRHRFRKG